jgi:hypothetical protein
MKERRFLRVLIPRKEKISIKNVKIGKNQFLSNIVRIVWEWNGLILGGWENVQP